MREGSIYLDPTRKMTPASAARTIERFKKMIEESQLRISDLEARKETVCRNLDEKIERELTYIQEAELVIRTLNEDFGEDLMEMHDAVLHHDVDGDNSHAVISELDRPDGCREIVLYGSPMF
jgi:hypothetical protein